jgi:phage anti-repressor protein
MTAVQIQNNKRLILANDFFALLKTKEDFMEWMYRRITDREMEANSDFYIFINSEAIAELSKHESFRDAESKKQLQEIIIN